MRIEVRGGGGGGSWNVMDDSVVLRDTGWSGNNSSAVPEAVVIVPRELLLDSTVRNIVFGWCNTFL